MGPVIIDLTETPPSSPPSNYIKLATGRLPPSQPQRLTVPQNEGPPAKRRRIDDDWAKRAMHQAAPYVSRALRGLPNQEYLIEEIAVQVGIEEARSLFYSSYKAANMGGLTQAVSIFVNDPGFLSRLNETNGYLLPPNDAETEVRARDLVRKLASLPKNQVRPKKLARETSPVAQTNPRPTTLKAREDSARPLTIARQLAASAPSRRQPHSERRNDHGAWKHVSTSSNSWFSLNKRPYQSAADRELIARGAKHLRLGRSDCTRPTIYHVDFTPDEIKEIVANVSKCLPGNVPGTVESLTLLCQQHNVPALVGKALPRRSVEDLRNLCSDLLTGTATPSSQGRVLMLDQDVDNDTSQNNRRASRVSSLLLAREMEGNRGFGRMRQYENFQNEFRKAHEDGLTLIAEFTNCAGDIATTTWVPDNNIICGTTAHSDTHNQQYNKPGNLLLCSTTLGQLRAFPDHRIPRPLVEKGENSTEAMRHSQDPWLYSSVVSSDYDAVHGFAYTSGFDKTVKVWKVETAGTSMSALATWHFDGNVNFVAAAVDGSRRVAAAADVPIKAVRIYTVDTNAVANSRYQSFSCLRTDADGSDKWAYFPATMQWGRGPGTEHLLAVGYSPRSLSGDDHVIPEDRRNSGEITLWDAARDCRVPVMTATTANFFEVVWHPTLPRFIAATSPCGLKVEPGVRTQIHLFRLDLSYGGYTEYRNLDCFASDINELTFMPNSTIHAYVTAGCTDGNVYVWDTAQADDMPMHTLKHGHPLDEYYEDREREDTGVKFTAWGSNLDRFYTGSSDGVVKVWNVRNGCEPHVRDLLEAPGPISCGAFSPDGTRLVIGDATGRVFVFSLDKHDEPETHFMTVPGLNRRLRRPTPFIPHPEPPPPDRDLDNTDDEDEDAHIADLARRDFLDSQQLILHPNPVIGAVQGPRYASTGLFRREAHLGDDPAGPLLTAYERQQRESILFSRGTRARSFRRLKELGKPSAQLQGRHSVNKARDLDIESLAEEELSDLIKAGADLSIDEDWGF